MLVSAKVSPWPWPVGLQPRMQCLTNTSFALFARSRASESTWSFSRLVLNFFSFSLVDQLVEALSNCHVSIV